MTIRARAEMHQPDPAAAERLQAKLRAIRDATCQHPWALVVLIVTVDDQEGRSVLAECACGEKLQKPIRAISQRGPEPDDSGPIGLPGNIGRE